MKTSTTWMNKMKTKLETAHIRDVRIKDIRVLALIMILGAIFHIGYGYFLIDGNSMESTYKEGDKLLVNKITYNFTHPELNDVIVFYDPMDNSVLIKRIIALPNDSVEIIQGVIFVNDAPLVDEHSFSPIATLLVEADGTPSLDWRTGEQIYQYANVSKIYLENDEYFAIGDNRTASWFGTVKKENIIGSISE
jgi:signal peptidase I